MATFVRKMLSEIADEMKRPRSDFEKYIGDLEANWYNSKEELMKVSDQEFFRLGLPGRLVTLIREKLGQGQQPVVQQAQQQVYPPQQYPTTQQGGYQQKTPTEAYQQNNQPQYQQPQQGSSKQMQQGPQKGQQSANYQPQPNLQQQYNQQPTQKGSHSDPSRIEVLMSQLRKRLNN